MLFNFENRSTADNLHRMNSASLQHVEMFNMYSRLQCFFFSRNIGYLTLKIIYFHYLLKNKSGSKYPKNILFNFENRSTGRLSRLK